MTPNEKEERELNLRCKIIFDMTKEIVENETDANNRLFYWAYHETWMLKLFPRCLASKKAYNLFYEKFGKDIRKYDWFNIPKWRDENNKRLFMHEHLTTSEDLKKELIYLYKNNQLNIEKIKTLILQQRVCWITRDEDNKLNTMGYREHRANPLNAYKDCGIEIYEAEKEDLTNIMIPSFNEDKSEILKDANNCNKQNSATISESVDLLERIKKELYLCLPNFDIHYSMSYIQIWKKTWNNKGKTGIHFELTPSQSKGFSSMFGKENFVITFKLHNECSTRNIMPQIANSKVYFKKEYSFLSHDIEKSINELINDIKRIISIDEANVDNAHKSLLNQ